MSSFSGVAYRKYPGNLTDSIDNALEDEAELIGGLCILKYLGTIFLCCQNRGFYHRCKHVSLSHLGETGHQSVRRIQLE